jgi:hypothetical protein
MSHDEYDEAIRRTRDPSWGIAKADKNSIAIFDGTVDMADILGLEHIQITARGWIFVLPDDGSDFYTEVPPESVLTVNADGKAIRVKT